MAEIHYLRASNHKKNVDFPSRAVSSTLVIHPGGGYNLEKMLFCFIPQGALQTKAVIHSPPSQGVPAELHRVSSPASLVTTKVRSLEVWVGCPLFMDAPEKILELEMITWCDPSVWHSLFFFYRWQLIRFRGSLAGEPLISGAQHLCSCLGAQLPVHWGRWASGSSCQLPPFSSSSWSRHWHVSILFTLRPFESLASQDSFYDPDTDTLSTFIGRRNTVDKKLKLEYLV